MNGSPDQELDVGLTRVAVPHREILAGVHLPAEALSDPEDDAFAAPKPPAASSLSGQPGGGDAVFLSQALAARTFATGAGAISGPPLRWLCAPRTSDFTTSLVIETC